MGLWQGLAAVGMTALAVAGVAFVGTVAAIEPARLAVSELVMVAYGSFFLGVASLVSAALARGVSQVGRAVVLARSTE